MSSIIVEQEVFEDADTYIESFKGRSRKSAEIIARCVETVEGACALLKNIKKLMLETLPSENCRRVRLSFSDGSR